MTPPRSRPPSRDAGAGRVAGWLATVVPGLLLFHARVGLGWVDPRRAPSLTVGDWSTYILAPNFLRGTGLWSLPLGRVPRYLAPVGSSLGNSDAAPYLLPLYRLVLPLAGDRPLQFVGLLLLCGYVGTYAVVQRAALRLLRARGDAALSGASRLSLSCLCGVAVAANPFLAVRIVHPSLLQQWVLIGALLHVLRRVVLPEAFAWQRRDGVVSVGLVALAAAVNPYLVPMVVLVLAPLLLGGGWRGRVAVRLGWLGAAVVLAAGVAVVSGYVGSGKRLQVDDFGDYNADLLSALNPFASSRLLHGWLPGIDDFEGRAFIGLGGLLLVGAALWTVLRVPAARAQVRRARGVALACAAALLYASLPTVRVGGATMWASSLGRGDSSFAQLVGVFRTNGRFAWPWSYLLLVGALVLVLQHVRRADVLMIVVLGAAMLQVLDTSYGTTPHTDPSRYAVARAVLEEARAGGVTELRVQPPFVTYECANPTTNINDTAPVLLAASVLGMSVDSGYPARGDARYRREICDAHAAAFRAGVRPAHVAYLLRAADPSVAGFGVCRPVLDGLVVCRR